MFASLSLKLLSFAFLSAASSGAVALAIKKETVLDQILKRHETIKVTDAKDFVYVVGWRKKNFEVTGSELNIANQQQDVNYYCKIWIDQHNSLSDKFCRIYSPNLSEEPTDESLDLASAIKSTSLIKKKHKLSDHKIHILKLSKTFYEQYLSHRQFDLNVIVEPSKGSRFLLYKYDRLLKLNTKYNEPDKAITDKKKIRPSYEVFSDLLVGKVVEKSSATSVADKDKLVCYLKGAADAASTENTTNCEIYDFDDEKKNNNITGADLKKLSFITDRTTEPKKDSFIVLKLSTAFKFDDLKNKVIEIKKASDQSTFATVHFDQMLYGELNETNLSSSILFTQGRKERSFIATKNATLTNSLSVASAPELSAEPKNFACKFAKGTGDPATFENTDFDCKIYLLPKPLEDHHIVGGEEINFSRQKITKALLDSEPFIKVMVDENRLYNLPTDVPDDTKLIVFPINETDTNKVYAELTLKNELGRISGIKSKILLLESLQDKVLKNSDTSHKCKFVLEGTRGTTIVQIADQELVLKPAAEDLACEVYLPRFNVRLNDLREVDFTNTTEKMPGDTNMNEKQYLAVKFKKEITLQDVIGTLMIYPEEYPTQNVRFGVKRFLIGDFGPNHQLYSLH